VGYSPTKDHAARTINNLSSNSQMQRVRAEI
jgi:hypothetical protein